MKDKKKMDPELLASENKLENNQQFPGRFKSLASPVETLKL